MKYVMDFIIPYIVCNKSEKISKFITYPKGCFPGSILIEVFKKVETRVALIRTWKKMSTLKLFQGFYVFV